MASVVVLQNIFRYAGDFAHLASFLILFYKIFQTKQVGGKFSFACIPRGLNVPARRNIFEDTGAVRPRLRHSICRSSLEFCVHVQLGYEGDFVAFSWPCPNHKPLRSFSSRARVGSFSSCGGATRSGVLSWRMIQRATARYNYSLAVFDVQMILSHAVASLVAYCSMCCHGSRMA